MSASEVTPAANTVTKKYRFARRGASVFALCAVAYEVYLQIITREFADLVSACRVKREVLVCDLVVFMEKFRLQERGAIAFFERDIGVARP